MNRARTPIIVAIAFAFGLLSSGALTAFAQLDVPELIRACVNNSSGGIRIIGPTDSCRNHESLLTWGTEGEPGPAGPPGAGLGGLTGRWEGSMSFPDGPCNGGEADLILVLVEDADGNLSGAGKNALDLLEGFHNSSSILGLVTGTDFEFDNGSSSLVFVGSIQDANNIAGTVSQDPLCQTGTWSAHRTPAVP